MHPVSFGDNWRRSKHKFSIRVWSGPNPEVKLNCQGHENLLSCFELTIELENFLSSYLITMKFHSTLNEFRYYLRPSDGFFVISSRFSKVDDLH